jgi:hypothetical protein
MSLTLNASYKEKEFSSLSALFNKYWINANCSTWNHYEERYSVRDADLISGGTTVFIEHKNRFESKSNRHLSFTRYNNAFIEQMKFDDLKDEYLRTRTPVLYIQEFDQYIFQWDITPYFKNNTLKSGTENCPAKTYDSTKGWTVKPVYYLEFYSSDAINPTYIKKDMYRRVSAEQYLADKAANDIDISHILKEIGYE